MYKKPSESSVVWYLAIAVVSFLLLVCVSAWVSSRKVAGVYRYVRSENRVTPANSKAHEGAMLTIKLGMLSTNANVRYPSGNVSYFTGELPFWYKTDLVPVDSAGNKIARNSDETYRLEYIPYKGGYPNVVLSINDKDGQFLTRFIFTLDAPKVPVKLDTSAHPEWTKGK